MHSRLEVVGVVRRAVAVEAHYRGVGVQNHILPVKAGHVTLLSHLLPAK